MKIIKLKDRYLLSALNISRVYLIDIILRESKKNFCYFFFLLSFLPNWFDIRNIERSLRSFKKVKRVSIFYN